MARGLFPRRMANRNHQRQVSKSAGRKEDNWVWSPQGIIDMHRPEKWGYVQFTRQPVGRARFVPDPASGARDVLQETYYAQKDFQKKNRRWAKTLGELPSLSPGLGANLAQPPVLTET